jgi:hypothetical protein
MVKSRTGCLGTALLILCGGLWTGPVHAEDGTFIQLTRNDASKTEDDWRKDLGQVKEAGINTLIIQWSAQAPVLYTTAPTNRLPRFTEQYPVLDRIFAAAGHLHLDVVLGLENDPEYWARIKARDRVLRDYFLVRVARNEELQKTLLEKFGDEPNWKGTYIPDEVDDLTWRAPDKMPFMKDYLSLMSRRLRVNDPDRRIGVSTFFRARTAPDIYARMLTELIRGASLDTVLVQDGIGIGDPPQKYISIYFRELRKAWDQAASRGEPAAPASDTGKPDPSAQATRPVTLPALWAVIELFEQTSPPNEPFSAQSADPERVNMQVQDARPYFDHLVYFTFLDYADPDTGEEAAALFNLLRE